MYLSNITIAAVTAVRDQGLCIGANHAIVAVEAI